jgi:hypothetical protein
MTMNPLLYRVTHGAGDGSRVEITSSLLDVSQPGNTSVITFDHVPSLDAEPVRYEFTLGSTGFRHVIASNYGVTFTDEVALQRGTLRYGSVVVSDAEIEFTETVDFGVWTGGVGAIYTALYNSSLTDMVTLLNRFELADGEKMQAKVGEAITQVTDSVGAIAVAKPLDGFGLLEVVQNTPEMAYQVPASGGTTVTGGQLYRESPGTAEETLLLVGATALTRIYPDPEVAESTLLTYASDVAVTWYPPSVDLR